MCVYVCGMEKKKCVLCVSKNIVCYVCICVWNDFDFVCLYVHV